MDCEICGCAVNVSRYAVQYMCMCICVYMFTCPPDCGLWDLLLIYIQVQRSLAQLLQVTSGGPAEALQRQTHVLLSNEQSLHHAFSGVQQICEGNLDGRTTEWKKNEERAREKKI